MSIEQKSLTEAEIRVMAHRYFQQGVSIPHPQHEGGPVVVNMPVWLEKLAAWLDRFVMLTP